MTLFVHRAERADALAAGVAELLADPLPDVFGQEIVAVPARGIERWLAQQLALRLGRRDGRADGICAGVQFPHPAAIVDTVVGTARHDPWSPDSLVWPLLEVIDESLGEPWCQTLSLHLGHGLPDEEQRYRRGRRYAVARRLAGLFDGYATNRPAMLSAWSQGLPVDGLGADLPPDLRWQSDLWRRLRDRVAAPDPIRRTAQALAALAADPATVELPARISLFGLTRLPVSQLTVLSALAQHRDVHLWLTHPSPRLWATIARAAPPMPMRRATDSTATLPAHSLLSSLGRDARELQLVLSTAPTTELHHDLARSAGTLLSWLQADLRDDSPAPDAGARRVSATDRSVQIHACHGPARQVDVLREVLVGLLAADQSLEPRDVLVMCPDIEVYAPLIAAAFGLADVVEDGHPAHHLRVRLADRALGRTNPLLATMARLLDLADGRVTASQVLDLASWPPVRRRFRFDDDDLERLAAWVADAGIRWGLDAHRRTRFALQRFQQNTWRFGLDRLLLGVTMSERDQNWMGTALPLDDVGSADVELAGALAELVNRLALTLDALTGEQSLTGWLDALTTGVARLTSVPPSEEWQTAQLRSEMAVLEEGAAGWAGRTMLSLPDVRALLRGRLGGRPTRANFRTGTLTVCTMVPMRSVPHRVVCLLGLDDGVFPRSPGIDGDDIIARDPAVGERDPRGEDRQLMLDAILAATEHLVVTYSGADERTGAPRPPSVPLGELLDALDETATGAAGKPVREQILTRHPLQSFDARNLRPGALGTPEPFSFDPTALAGARAARRPPVPAPAFLPAALPAARRGDIELADLVALILNPARGFLRQRLDVAVRFEEDDPADGLTVELDALQLWALGDRILRRRLAGVQAQTCRDVEWRRGTLPPGPLGSAQLTAVMSEVDALVEATTRLRAVPGRTVEVVAELTDGRQLRGTVPGVRGTDLLTVSYSKLGPRDRLRAWLMVLALTASDPGTPWTATAVGRTSGGRPRGSRFGPLNKALATRALTHVVAVYDSGLRAPLPMATKTSAEYAAARANGRDPADAASAAARTWAGGQFPGENADSANEQVWGRASRLAVLRAAPPGPDERRPDESSRFGALAAGLWTPLLAAERLRTL